MENALSVVSIVGALIGVVALLVMRPAGTSLFRQPGVWVMAAVLAVAIPPLVFPTDSPVVYLGSAASLLCTGRGLWLLLRPRKDVTSTAS